GRRGARVSLPDRADPPHRHAAGAGGGVAGGAAGAVRSLEGDRSHRAAMKTGQKRDLPQASARPCIRTSEEIIANTVRMTYEPTISRRSLSPTVFCDSGRLGRH